MKKILFSLLLVHVFTLSFGQTFLINEDFQTGIPGTWQNITDDTSTVHPDVDEFVDAWIIKENPDSTGDSVIASTSYFEHGGLSSRWIITPQIQLGAFGNFIEWDAKSHDPSFPDGYHVLISRTNDSLHNFTDTIFYTDFELPDWTSREYQLVDSTFANELVYIAFQHSSDDQFILYLDNIKVRTEDPLSTIEKELIVESTVYPNPFSSSFTIQSNFELIGLNITDISGKLVREFQGDIQVINGLEDLQTGFYFLNLSYKNGLFEQKKLIKR